MKYKLDYITRFFQKTSSKAIENYVLTRLWHRLNNDQIKIVPQQYVNRHNEKYALTDVYFPQFKIHIEVNEPAHYLSEERILADKTRKHQIESITGHKLIEIDCRKDLLEIHEDIEKIIIEIQELTKYQILNNKFKPWNPDMERNPKFWKEKNTISIKDEVSFSNIEDICELFDANFMQTKRGFLRLGGISHPQNNQILLWWPSSHTRQGWVNKINEAENAIIETHTDENKKKSHFLQYRNSNQIRYVFFHSKDTLGLTSYKFVGIFAYDLVESNEVVGTVWKKIGNSIILNPNSYN